MVGKSESDPRDKTMNLANSVNMFEHFGRISERQCTILREKLENKCENFNKKVIYGVLEYLARRGNRK